MAYDQDSFNKGLVTGLTMYGLEINSNTGSGTAGVNIDLPPYSDESLFEFDPIRQEITDFLGSSSTDDMIVPPTINGVEVKRIKEYALISTGNTELRIPSTVINLGTQDIRNATINIMYPIALKTNNFINSIGSPNVVIDSDNVISKIEFPSIASPFDFNIASLTLSNKVKYIDRAMFYNCYIPALVIPYSLRVIGDYAFENNAIDELELGYVEKIGYRAFRNNNITNILLPPSLKYLGYYAFEDNPITSVTLNSNLEENTTGAIVFNNCIIGNNLTIVDGVTRIPQQLFQNAGITSLSIPDSVEVIYSGAFKDNNIPLIVLDNATDIRGDAFENNINISVELRDNYTGYSDSALVFHNCNLQNRLTIYNTVSEIAAGMFGYSGLTEVIFPNTIKLIYSGAFKGNSLTSLVFHSGLTYIGYYAFQYNLLTSIALPSSVTTIGNGAFEYNDIINITIGSDVIIGSYNALGNYGDEFKTFYYNNGQLAGTYNWNGVNWS